MTNEKKIRFQAIVAGVLLCCTLLSCGNGSTESSGKEQPQLSYRTATVLDSDGRTFRT